MALIFPGKSCCSICDGVLGRDDAVVATTHFIANRADPLWRFSDSGMHLACYEAWAYRDEFAARYEAARGERPGLIGRA